MWDAFATLDILLDIVLVVLPISNLWTLQMPWASKAPVIAAFLFRLV